MRTFQRRTEDFTCGHCGVPVTGSGYTNHCPKCLHSTHVDINPGDRAAACGGLMEPVRVEKDGERYDIVHRCTVCRGERRCRTAPEDDYEVILKLAGG